MSSDIFTENSDLAAKLAPALRMLYQPDGKAICVFCGAIEEYDKSKKTLILEQQSDCKQAFESFHAENDCLPEIVVVNGVGLFALGKNAAEANAVKRAALGERERMSDGLQEFSAPKRLDGKIAIVTGGAQGFGKGLARAMAAEGAYVVIADLNKDGAESCANELCGDFGAFSAAAVHVDVSDEKSVKNMVDFAVLTYGGLDIMLSNAGILFAGSLPEMSLEKFRLVTNVNYSGYFLCAKYASVPMKLQHNVNPAYTADIIEINSKSGLEGSNKNFAYAGSKFGGIGLTQSFALELVEYGIKVNAICPGNLLDGPLWSDPEKGLFRQYLDTGKVPGAKSIADVRAFYEAKVPMRRGCTPEDVAIAIFYVIEQKYETGQAIPVTGGQIMLK